MSPFSIFVQAFFQGFTGAGLFGGLRRPGAPTEFVDSRSVEEFLADLRTQYSRELHKLYPHP